MEALESMIAERGIEGLRVSRVAEEANVSKVLIYRYSGSLDGLMDYYVRMGKLFPTFSLVMMDPIRPVHESDLSRMILGAISYLTLMAQNSRTMIDLNLRSENDWTRIEDAVKLICTALGRQLAATGEVIMNAQTASTLVSSW